MPGYPHVRLSVFSKTSTIDAMFESLIPSKKQDKPIESFCTPLEPPKSDESSLVVFV
jgi:hypothetical protein